MNGKTRTALVMLAILAVAGVAFASILVHREVPTSIRIKKTATMGVYDTDGTTDLLSFNFGDFFWLEGKWVPSGADEGENPSSTAFWVKNIDQMNFYVQFGLYPLPSGVDFTIAVKRQSEATWLESYQFDGTSAKWIYSLPLTSPSLDTDPAHDTWHALQFQFKVHVNEDAAFGTFAPLLEINAVDTPTG